MMGHVLWIGIPCMFLAGPLYAFQSTLVEVEGKACMGDDKSRKQTEQAAMADAKRQAAERVMTHIKSETRVEDYTLKADLVDAYARASVKVVEEREKGWVRDAASGDCYRVKIRAEVVPDEKALEKAAAERDPLADPTAPLKVKLWTDRRSYRGGEKIKIYVKGNKPFYARILYRDAAGNLLQLLPNPYRRDNYFQGGVVYEIPSGEDRFELEVSAPYGGEDIILYGATAPLGDLKLQTYGDVYRVMTNDADIPRLTRGVQIKGKEEAASGQPAEFYEEKWSISTGK
ncbi:MAG: DUF4384 domain-containing protein [Syntrophales bacterium]|nr:DUF4384 domain-containing protein [Syntrophales bacterium]